jgi:hypothetical protein
MLRISTWRARPTLNTWIVKGVALILIVAFILIHFRILP